LEQKPSITPKEVTAAPRSVKWLRGAIAICIILLMGSILLNFHFWSKGAEVRMENNQLRQQNDSLKHEATHGQENILPIR
jgi:cell division septal protein FtsQ